MSDTLAIALLIASGVLFAIGIGGFTLLAFDRWAS